MKKLVILFLLLGLISCNTNALYKSTEKLPTDSVYNIPKIVFVVVGKNIDFNKMDVDSIINTVMKNDSLLELKPVSPEIQLKPRIIKVYTIQDISCNYLKEKFKDYDPGQLLFEYNDKILVKTKDGVMRVYHRETKE